mmetsp:Transcript_33194/g.91499  ORF Transcript_33194/g.91499 Transcript_33194/m.91499 type:complete len:269 (+) Transcript_33194:360-1166(+)
MPPIPGMPPPAPMTPAPGIPGIPLAPIPVDGNPGIMPPRGAGIVAAGAPNGGWPICGAPGPMSPPRPLPSDGAGAGVEETPANGSKPPEPSEANPPPTPPPPLPPGVAKGSKPPIGGGADGGAVCTSPPPPSRSLLWVALGVDVGAEGGGGAFGMEAGGTAGAAGTAFRVPAKSNDSKSCGSSAFAGALGTTASPLAPNAELAWSCASFFVSYSLRRDVSTRCNNFLHTESCVSNCSPLSDSSTSNGMMSGRRRSEVILGPRCLLMAS